MPNSKGQDAAERVWKSRWFLPGAMGVAAMAEFLLNRLLQPILTTALGTSKLLSALFVLGRFSLNLATVLGVMVVAALIWRATEPGGAMSRPLGRLSALCMGALLCGHAVAWIVFPEGRPGIFALKRLQWLVQLATVCLASLTVLGLLSRPKIETLPKIRPRHKLAVVLLLLPPLLLLETQWRLLTEVRVLQRYGLLTLIYGPVLAVIALGAGSLALTKLPPRPRRFLPAACALLATTTMTAMLHRFPNLTARVIYMSFDLRLPPHAEAYGLYLLSLCAWVFAVVALVVGQGQVRPRALGLVLVGLGGCQTRALHQMLFYLAGLLCIVDELLEMPRLERERAHPAAQSNRPNSAA